jgi:hypothetical protein
MISEKAHHEFNAPRRGNVREPNKSRMQCILDENELAEVFVHRYKDAPFRRRPLEQKPVPGIGTALAEFDYVMPLVA